MGRSCNIHGEARNSKNISVGIPKGRKQLGKLSRIWEDIIKMESR
jgi:hypothetical protein